MVKFGARLILLGDLGSRFSRVQVFQPGRFIGGNRHDAAQTREIEHFTYPLAGAHDYKTPAGMRNGSINANQKADAGGVDVRDVAKVGHHLAAAGVSNFLSLGMQISRVQAGREPSLRAEDADVASVFE